MDLLILRILCPRCTKDSTTRCQHTRQKVLPAQAVGLAEVQPIWPVSQNTNIPSCNNNNKTCPRIRSHPMYMRTRDSMTSSESYEIVLLNIFEMIREFKWHKVTFLDICCSSFVAHQTRSSFFDVSEQKGETNGSLSRNNFLELTIS